MEDQSENWGSDHDLLSKSLSGVWKAHNNVKSKKALECVSLSSVGFSIAWIVWDVFRGCSEGYARQSAASVVSSGLEIGVY